MRNWRVGIQSGIPFGACFWKNDPPCEALAPALHRERAIAQVRHDRVCDVAVVTEEVALRDAVVGEEDAVGGRELDLVRHRRTAHMTLARLGIAYVPSGTSSPSLAITTSCSAGGLLAIQLIDRTLSSMPLRSSTWSCGNAVLGDSAERAALDELLEGRTGAHGGERRSMELLELRAIRLGPRIGSRVVALVPDECEHPARPQHARELRHGLVVREPVERLCCEHPVDGRVRERQLLRRARVALGLGHDPIEDGTHPVERLDREHASVVPREHARQLPGAGPHVDDGGLGAERQDIEHRVGVVRPRPLVFLRGAVEAPRLLGAINQRRRAGRRDSP